MGLGEQRKAIVSALSKWPPLLSQVESVSKSDDAHFEAELERRIRQSAHRQWASHGATAVLRSAIAKVGENERQKTNPWREAWRGFSPDEAKKLAQSILLVAFDTPAVKNMLDLVAKSVVEDISPVIAKRIEAVIERTVECIRSASSTSTGMTPVSRVFTLELEHALASGRIKLGNVTLEHAQHGVAATMTVTGVAALVVRQVGRRVGTNVANQVAGRIGARLASRALPLLGTFFVLYDVYDIWRGGPTRAITEMLMKEDRVYTQSLDLVSTTLGTELRETYGKEMLQVVQQLIEGYKAVERQYGALITLAKADARVEALLQSLAPTQLRRLREMAEQISHSDLTQAVATRAVVGPLQYPEAVYTPFLTVLAHVRRLATARSWVDEASDLLPSVARRKVHTMLSPTDLSRVQLQRVLALPDEALPAVAILPASVRRKAVDHCSAGGLAAFARNDRAAQGRAGEVLELTAGRDCMAAAAVGARSDKFQSLFAARRALLQMSVEQRRQEVAALAAVDLRSAVVTMLSPSTPELARRYAAWTYGPGYAATFGILILAVWFFGGEWLRRRSTGTGPKV